MVCYNRQSISKLRHNEQTTDNKKGWYSVVVSHQNKYHGQMILVFLLWREIRSSRKSPNKLASKKSFNAKE